MKLPLENGKYRRPARTIAVFLSFLALAVWFFHLYVWYGYDGKNPLHPDGPSGRIYALDTHGHIVYLNKEEDTNLTDLTILAFSLFGIACLAEGLFVSG